MRSVYFTDAHEEFRARVRTFLTTHVAPYAAVWEEDRALPRSLWRALGAEGLLGLAHPRSAGGGGHDLFTSVVFLEELGRLGFGGLRAAVSVHAYMATHYLAASGGPELCAAYLAPAVRGDKIAALALTEPGAGADLSRLATTAERDGDHYVVTGTKTMVSNGTAADFQVAAVRTAPPSGSGRRGATGLSLLVIDASLPGVTAHPLPTLGWRAAGTATVRYDAVRVPADRLIGRRDSGFYYLMRGLERERLVAAVLALGGMERTLDDARAAVAGRQLFGGTLGDLQAPLHRLADLATELTAARHLVHHAAWCLEQGAPPGTACSMAKLHTTELACRIAEANLHLQGARGYLDTSDAARAHRDAQAATLAAGPSEVMRDLIGRSLLRDP